jgi:hypothetical protein
MVTVALFVRLEAKPGKEPEVESFSKAGCQLSKASSFARTGGLQMKMFPHSNIAAMAGVSYAVGGFLSAARAATCSFSVGNVVFGSLSKDQLGATDQSSTDDAKFATQPYSLGSFG